MFFLDKRIQYEEPGGQHGHNYAMPFIKAAKKEGFSFRKCYCCCNKAKNEVLEETLTSKLIKTEQDARLYTGLRKEVFLALVQTMKQFASDNIKMNVCDQILMTLMKLRLNLVGGDLARRFNVSAPYVYKIISFWIENLAKQLKQLIFFLPRETIRATMPKSFKNYPKTTCIMDCAETFMQKPNNLRARAETYSNYKANNTVKYNVTIAPCGFIMHISQAYSGRCSDKFIVKHSGVLKHILPGDEVMADRGFTIQDLLYSKKAKLNIPAFTHGKQLTRREVTRTRRIASVRIHVERVIRRMKVFKILKDTVHISMAKKMSNVLTIVAALVNFDNDLIRE